MCQQSSDVRYVIRLALGPVEQYLHLWGGIVLLLLRLRPKLPGHWMLAEHYRGAELV
jgi:hypothetical protein